MSDSVRGIGVVAAVAPLGAAARLAALVRAGGSSRASIGYNVAVSATWGGRFAAVDPRYKFGADFDLLLRFPHGIINTNTCAEGLSPHDAYRVAAPAAEDADGRFEYIDGSPGAAFRLVAANGPYELYARR